MSEALRDFPGHLLKVEKAEKDAFQKIIRCYMDSRTLVLDLCSGTGRTRDWILEASPQIEVFVSDLDKDCLEMLCSCFSKERTICIDINEKDWNLSRIANSSPAFDFITCFGGLNHFVNWEHFFKNIFNHSFNHVLHFNRSDSKQALGLHTVELRKANYSYIGYNKGFIKDLYEHFGYFTIQEIVTTKYSYLVYASNKGEIKLR